MGFWKSKKRLDVSRERLAMLIANRILGFQRRLADRLNAKAQVMKRSRVIALLLLMGFLAACYCIWLVLKVLFSI